MTGGDSGEGESDLRQKAIEEALVSLFTHKVPTMNTADAETLSARVVKTMLEAGILVPEEEWVKLGQGTVLKNMTQDTEEKATLAMAIEEIKAVTLECDAKVDEQSKKVEMIDLQSKLFLRPGMERVELNLDHLGRELIFKGELQRAGANRFTWLETHCILFDHYLVLAKLLNQRDKTTGKQKDVYDVSKLLRIDKTGPRPGPVCRAQVNCATAFNCFGKAMIAIGTDYGVYTSEANNPRGWTR
ncbi:putative Rho1 guanine nucleotide exchange factor 3 [Glarea lozoyensis 74030]|uniref:Putative Rho1 guanine nucleotide exchange factor 3 n=1 Tax=Glarea lozoyensis (strain ATCC 74030 / MF5533) TaxID=1104152 RepID=H0ED92_GLAL7|nr:putative Rho1 guanine nucleotide exchange factor 3 [Glarea lozoyensis 74030]